MPEPLNGLLPGRGPGVGRAAGVAPPSGALCSAGAAGATGVAGAAAAAAGATGATGAAGAGACGGAAGAGALTGAGAGAAGPAGVGPAGVGPAGVGAAAVAAAAGFGAGFGAAGLAGAASGAAEAGNASRSFRSTGASMVEAADFTYSPFAFNHATASLLGIPNSLASVLTRTFDTSLLVLVRADLVSGHGPLVPSGHAHRSELIECSFPFRSSIVQVRSRRSSGIDPRSYRADLERTVDPQGPRKRPASLRPVQALEPRMQVRTAARLPRSGVREAQAVPGGDPKQCGLACPRPATDAGTRRFTLTSRWNGV